MELKKILIVDDDAGIRRIAELSLTKVGKLEVSLAKSGAEALQLLANEKPDLILLDVMMPGMDGPAVLAELRRNPDTANIPVVFLTAKIQQRDVDSYAKLGALGVIGKPFEPTELAQELRKLYAQAMATT